MAEPDDSVSNRVAMRTHPLLLLLAAALPRRAPRRRLPRHLPALLACLAEPDRNRLLPARHPAARAALQRTLLLPPHCRLDALRRGLAVLCHLETSGPKRVANRMLTMCPSFRRPTCHGRPEVRCGMAFVVMVGLAAALAGTIASFAGFGIGSVLTPLLAIRLGTKLAVAAMSIPHVVGTSVRV